MQHAIQQRDGFARGGSPANYTQQDEAKLARDALSWRQEMLRKRKEAPNTDLHHIDSMVADEYRGIGFPEGIPSIDARDLALQPNVLFPQHYPNASGGFGDLQDLVRTYGLDQRTTPYSANEAYRRLAGEAEARATQARIPLTAEQRLATFPEDSYDVPMNQLIIRGLLGTK
jgi:hypothetical protein